MSSESMSRDQRRAQRLARYDELRAERPHLFVNPPDAAYEIVFDETGQSQVADESAAKLRAVGKPEEYGDIGVIYEDSFVIGVRDAVRFRDGGLGPFIRIMGSVVGTGAAVLPVLPDGRIVLIRHFRHDSRSWHWEIPRGFAEPGADGATTAGRELTEELGVPVGKVELLGRFANDAEFDEIFLARLDVPELPAEGTRDAFLEGIDDVRLVTREQLEAMMVAGEMTDSYTLAAYGFAVARGAL